MTHVEGAKVHPSHKPITVVLLGTNSSNKCLIGNAILRQHCFAAGPEMIQLLDNTSVRIINTSDNLSEQEATSKEELSPSYPDPRLFLLVLEDNKLSQEEIKLFNYLKERFGKNIVENTIVVKVSGEEESSATPADENLKKVLNECEEQISVRKNEDVKESDLMKQLKEKWEKIQKRLPEPSTNEDLYEDIDANPTNESTEQGEDPKVQQPHKDISMVLLGLKNNKYMIGNAILQEEWFGAGKERHSKVKQVEDRMICVIDSPDNLHWPIPQPVELNPSYPDPRLFLLVLQDNKLSQEEIKMFDDFKGRFGEKMVENTIVVLVRGEEERSGDPNEPVDNSLEKILDECGKRVCVLKKNQDMKESELMKQLLEIWDKMEANSSAYEEHEYEDIDDIGVMKMKQTDESNVISGEIARPTADITVVLLGKNNDEKCLIGNIILGEKRFKSEDCETNTGKAEDQSVLLIKTSDSLNPEAHAIEEIQPSYTGPRVFLLILQGQKVSQEEADMFIRLKKAFGEHIVKNTILLVDSEKPLVEDSIYTKKLLTECENKVCCYNKDVTENKLVEELMEYMGIMERDQASKPVGERCNSLRFPPVNFNGPYENSFPLKSCVEPTPNMSEVLVHQEHSLDRMIASFMTIVLLGQTGSGKSATGNTILGKQCFESHASSVPVTQECQTEEGKVCGVKIRVVDTPDFFNEDLKNKEEQLRLCKDLIQQGPVVYLLVMELGRFTDGEREVLPHLKKEFGEDMTAKTVILFTNKEKLTGKTLKDYINETDEELQKLIGTCHSRCCAFNNNKKSSQQVKELMHVIVNMQTHGNMTMKPQRNALDKIHSKCRIM